LPELEDCLDELDGAPQIVVYCKAGARSARALDLLHRQGHAGALSLAGGILAWARDVDPSLPTY
jgi:sulfur-carrier protein adenylyltransferase/sulfurtransferase